MCMVTFSALSASSAVRLHSHKSRKILKTRSEINPRGRTYTIHFRSSPSAKIRCASMAADALLGERDRMASRISEC